MTGSESPLAAVVASWQLPVWSTAALIATACLYVRGWRRLHAQAEGRFGAARVAAFCGGLLAVWVAIASPLDAFAALLLGVHMAQHLLLLMVAPPLLWLGAPALPLLRGLPHTIAKHGLGPFLAWPRLQRTLRVLAHPIVSWTAFAVAVVGWHLPGPYQLALRAPAWHQAEHFSFLAAGLLFWWPVVQPWPSRPIWPRWTMIPYLLLADLLNTALSGFFAFSNRVIYPIYAAAPRLWGVTALADQVSAGALMWVPGSLVFLLPVASIVIELMSGPAVRPPAMAAGLVPERHRPSRRPRSFDLLTLPMLGSFLRWRYGRRTLQLAMLAAAAAVIADGLIGPPMAPMNLAGVLPWTFWRAALVLGLLIGGNLFCMACPFTLPREVAKRLLPAARAWPRWLRTKWLGAALLVLFLWAYETQALWDSPRATALIAVAYFAAAFAVDGLFRGASFCKYVCPIGQFQFVQSLASPLAVRPRRMEVCHACTTHDCLRGNSRHRGCELELFQPEKRGNLDCTFCLDCVVACPHQNVGILVAAPARELARDPFRSSIRRLSERLDFAVLALVTVFGAFANAAGMVQPVLAAEHAAATRLGLASTDLVVSAGLALALLVVPAAAVVAAAAASRRLAAESSPLRALVGRFTFALIPLGLAMWTAHFLFHALPGFAALPALVRRVATDLGAPMLGAPRWGSSAAPNASEWLTAMQLILLDAGLLASAYFAWRIAVHLRGRSRHAVALLAPWTALMAVLWIAGVWIVFQPMQMRGMVH